MSQAPHTTPVPFSPSCNLTITSRGQSASRATWHGDVTFLAGITPVLLIGLHPERGNVAVRNAVFARGESMWDYNWVDVEYPTEGGYRFQARARDYEFAFGDEGFILLCDDVILLSIPYEELSEEEGWKEGITGVMFQIGDADRVDMEYAEVCRGGPRWMRDYA